MREGMGAAAALVSLLGAALLLTCAGACRTGPGTVPGDDMDAVSDVVATEDLASRLDRTAAELVRTLARFPSLLPPDPGRGAPVVFARFDHRGADRECPQGPLAVRGGSLWFERERAARRSRPPDYWVIVTDAEGREALYWAPLSRPGWILAESSDPERGTDMEGTAVRSGSSRVSVRLPFFPGALAVLYRADGGRRILPEDILRMGAAPPSLYP